MDFKAVDRIVNALLYEGYILYPYRPSAVKNRQRFNFGTVFPEAFSEAQKGAEPCVMQTEVPVTAGPGTTVDVKVRFLHLIARELGKVSAPRSGAAPGHEPCYEIVDFLESRGQLFRAWQEAAEREIDIPNIDLRELFIGGPRTFKFEFGAHQDIESLAGDDKNINGVIVRTQWQVAGAVEVSAESHTEHLCRLRVRIQNLTPLGAPGQLARDAALMRSMLSAHTILVVSRGEFVSLLEPPEYAAKAVASCQNIGTWPVMAGDEGERDCMLSSPIILYDYPKIAPESPGDLFDGTEIDEILTLRIMTMTGDEKREMRAVDERARRILERTENLSALDMDRLHGTFRTMRRSQEEGR